MGLGNELYSMNGGISDEDCEWIIRNSRTPSPYP